MTRFLTASATGAILVVSAGLIVGACAPVTPEARAAMMERAHTPAERAEHSNRVRHYWAATRAY